MSNNDNLIKFKDLADRIKSIAEGNADIEDFDLEDIRKGGITERFLNILSEKLAEPAGLMTEEEIYEEITDNFLNLTELLCKKDFSFFRFTNYDSSREIILDGKEYDLDGEFCHDDQEATEALCAIDCLIADSDKDTESVLKKVEGMVNIRNRKEK